MNPMQMPPVQPWKPHSPIKPKGRMQLPAPLAPRLTEEEVNEFNPTLDNPLEVACDTGEYTEELSIVKIISIGIQDCFSIIRRDGSLGVLSEGSLKQYPSQKKPTTKMVQFYNVILKNTSNVLYMDGYLVTKNMRNSIGKKLELYAATVVKLIPVCEIEMPIDFEE